MKEKILPGIMLKLAHSLDRAEEKQSQIFSTGGDFFFQTHRASRSHVEAQMFGGRSRRIFLRQGKE